MKQHLERKKNKFRSIASALSETERNQGKDLTDHNQKPQAKRLQVIIPLC